MYTVPAATSVVASTLAICNVTSSSVVCDVNVKPLGAATTAVHALMRSASIDPNATVFLTVGLTLATTDVISVRSATANALAFHLYGTVIT
jgi:hypothetical protein